MLNEIFAGGLRKQTTYVSDNVRFFFFGCWNKERNATANIIELINNENICTFGVVCGDNVYPVKDKENNTKVAQKSDIIEGFNILKRFRHNIYVGLGNHEVDTTLQCQALIDEKQEATSNIIMENNYYSIDVIDIESQTLVSKIIILDTNLLEENTCYGEHNENEENAMINWLQNELSECLATNVTPIVAGHYPLFYFKQNKTTLNIDFMINHMMNKFTDIFTNFKHPIYYLCADVHNYQHILHDNITQHIVGTGGAEQDPIFDASISFTMNVGDKIFHIIRCAQKYGYLHVDVANNIVTGEFKESSVHVNIKIKEKKEKEKKEKKENIINV